jgi:hypothetical protein
MPGKAGPIAYAFATFQQTGSLPSSQAGPALQVEAWLAVVMPRSEQQILDPQEYPHFDILLLPFGYMQSFRRVFQRNSAVPNALMKPACREFQALLTPILIQAYFGNASSELHSANLDTADSLLPPGPEAANPLSIPASHPASIDRTAKKDPGNAGCVPFSRMPHPGGKPSRLPLV